MQEKTAKKLSTVGKFSAFVGFLILFTGIVLFLITDGAIVYKAVGFAVLVFGELLLGLVALIFSKKINCGKSGKIFAAAGIFILFATVVTVGILSFNINLFQPFALSPLAGIFIFTGGIFLAVSLVLLFFGKINSAKIIISSVTLIAVFASGIIWISAQKYEKFNENAEHFTVFSGGEEGYTSFRIPALSVLNKDIINENQNTAFENDLLIAIAEGRKNSARDLGQIDLVYKISVNGGKDWSPLSVFPLLKEAGKAGNPTVFFDKNTGKPGLLYMAATAQNNYAYSTYFVTGTIDESLKITLSEPICLSENDGKGTGKGDGVDNNTLMVGPGKIIQTASGRLIAPASNRGKSFALLSDDGGKTWTKSADALDGNECEIALLPDGNLVMVSRQNGAMGLLTKQYIRLVYSKDGGETWGENVVTSLKTPVCMSSVHCDGEKLFLTHPSDFYTRANLTVSVSSDSKNNFVSTSLYSGASGYSCTLSDGNDLLVLAEIGRINYSEKLELFRIEKRKI